MNVEELHRALSIETHTAVRVRLPDGSFVPDHFHVTEIGRVRKDFVDCGGTPRTQAACVLQIWVASDTHHRLHSDKLTKILELGLRSLEISGFAVEVEYEAAAGSTCATISQFDVTAVSATPSGIVIQLGARHTGCLAENQCLLPLADTCCSDTNCCPVS